MERSWGRQIDILWILCKYLNKGSGSKTLNHLLFRLEKGYRDCMVGSCEYAQLYYTIVHNITRKLIFSLRYKQEIYKKCHQYDI